jgi:hypothetical protein
MSNSNPDKIKLAEFMRSLTPEELLLLSFTLLTAGQRWLLEEIKKEEVKKTP